MACDKIQYLTKALARAAALQVKGKTKKTYDVYICGECGFFHLYTATKKKVKYDRKFIKRQSKYPIKTTNFPYIKNK